ncbi:MAG TPA: trigger factor [Acidimicrobiales bacterium]|jgi:trigger factor|nr:trigger factor [Acidimicrobiales bacterium]
MKATVEPLEGNKVKLSVEVDEQEFEKRVDATLRRIAREVRIPGFRPGKAPRRLLESRMGKAGVRQETMRDALPEFYAEAVRQTEIDAIAPPDIDITGGEEEGPVQFDAVVEVRPQLQLAGYQGLRVTIPSPEVTDEELQRQIDRLRQPFGELKEVERPAQDGDHVTFDISGSQDGEPVAALTADDYLYEVGSGGILPEVDDNLRGASTGDILEFDAAIGDETVQLKIVVKDIKEMILPEVTDEWASEASEFETVAELTDDLRRRMGEVKKMQANLQLRDEVVKALVELVEDDVPDALVNAEMERRLHDVAHRLEHQGVSLSQYLQATGQGQEEFVDDLRKGATESVKADLALRAVADGEAIEAGEEDVDNEIAKLAEQMNTNALDVRQQLERADQMPAVRSDIRKAKALGWLMEHVEIVDEEGNAIDRADLEPTPAADTADVADDASAESETE